MLKAFKEVIKYHLNNSIMLHGIESFVFTSFSKLLQFFYLKTNPVETIIELVL